MGGPDHTLDTEIKSEFQQFYFQCLSWSCCPIMKIKILKKINVKILKNQYLDEITIKEYSAALKKKLC